MDHIIKLLTNRIAKKKLFLDKLEEGHRPTTPEFRTKLDAYLDLERENIRELEYSLTFLTGIYKKLK